MTNIDKLIETFEKKKFEMSLYHHIDQINVQKEGYELLSKITDVGIYPLFKPICWIIPFKNSVPHMFTLMKYGRYANKCIIDIGSCHGASIIAMGIGAKMNGGNNPKLITIDVIQTECETKGYFELFKEFLPSDRLVVQSDSKLYNFNEPIDLLYIDGSHEYEDVYVDCKKYVPLVMKGGVCIFHDSNDSSVSKAITKYFEDNKDKIKFEYIKDNVIDSPINSDDRFLYNNVGISAIKIL